MGCSTKGQCCRKDIQTLLPPCENDLNASLAECAEVNKTCLLFFQMETRLTNLQLCHAEGNQFFWKQTDSFESLRNIEVQDEELRGGGIQSDCFNARCLKMLFVSMAHVAAQMKNDWMYMFPVNSHHQSKKLLFCLYFFFNHAGRQIQSNHHNRLDTTLLIPNSQINFALVTLTLQQYKYFIVVT